MSLWTRIADALAALRAGESLSQVFDRMSAPPERTVAFAIAVIALGAKLAKADGIVTRDEVAAFRAFFRIPPGEEMHAARVYNLARQDVAGFEEYASRIRRLFGDRDPGDGPLCDLMEGLFEIAVVDGDYRAEENEFLSRVAEILRLDRRDFERIRARFVPEAEQNPFDVLGVSPDAPPDAVRAAWKAAVRDCHPDRLAARGVPPEALALAEHRLVAVNRAWERINGKAA